jgi:predicted nucleic-acid-binding protein
VVEPLDTNVIIRYLLEDPATTDRAFRGVFQFFEKLERAERKALLTPVVLFQTYFVLTSYYEVPRVEAVEKLTGLLSFKGLTVSEKPILRSCLKTLSSRSVDLVDAYLTALCTIRQLSGVYSFDRTFQRLGVKLLPVD